MQPKPDQPTTEQKLLSLAKALYNTGFVDGQNYAEDEKTDDAFVDEAVSKLEALLLEARIDEAEKISMIFDMSEFDISGTMLDPHMMSRSKEWIAESRQYNSDHAWSAMSAQGKIKKHIEALTRKQVAGEDNNE